MGPGSGVLAVAPLSMGEQPLGNQLIKQRLGLGEGQIHQSGGGLNSEGFTRDQHEELVQGAGLGGQRGVGAGQGHRCPPGMGPSSSRAAIICLA